MGNRPPLTRAVHALRAAGVTYTEHVFDYERFPGAIGAAEALGVDPHVTVKTIVFTTGADDGVTVLMHGNREVSTKKLARAIGVKAVRPASQSEAGRFTGYQFGGTSPLGMRTDIPVLAQETLAGSGTVYVNGGSRGFLVAIDADILIRLTGARLADLAAR